MSVIHFSFASDGGASRAGRRASLACRAVGMNSSFAFVSGERVEPDDIHIFPAPTDGPEGPIARVYNHDFQWNLIPNNRTAISNTLVSIPYPGVDVGNHRAFDTADILHLHWPTWAFPPRALARALEQGKHVFWTLHDMWPMTGGCHYAAGCDQFETLCLKCPQMLEDHGLINNQFEEKRNCYSRGGSLHVIAPSRWMADVARKSAILGGRPIHVVRNPVELDVFQPREARLGLRAAYGVKDRDFVLMMGSADLREKRKGAILLVEALRRTVAEGSLTRALPGDAAVHLLFIGKELDVSLPKGVKVLKFGEISDDSILADLFSLADVLVAPSLEDNYPNMIIEAMACGTPVIGFDAGGVAEMIEDGVTGMVVRPAGSVAALSEALVDFAKTRSRWAAMREACRAHAETVADPIRIGVQLRGLYEHALGRPMTPIKPDLYGRMLRGLANAPSKADVIAGQHMLAFPANLAVAARVESAASKHFPIVERFDADDDGRTRLIAVRTFHEHHSARSGPYQFLRHLPSSEYEMRNYAVPLDSGLVTKSRDSFRRAGILAGANGMAQQGNGWLAEAEILIECAERRIDVVHFIDGELTGNFLPSLPDFSFHQGKRPLFVATYHQPERVLKGLINPFIVAQMDGVVALCEPQREWLARLTDPRKVRIIPHGIDTQFFCPAASPRASSTKTMRLLMVGHWLRDVKVALTAFQMLRGSEFDFELRIISPRFNASVSDDKIVLLKGLSDEELREEYRSADILYLPLEDATANNAVLEAMACSLPVVSTRVGGVPEAVGEHAGLLCEPGDARAFARSVLALARSAELRLACGAAGRAQAELLSWRRIATMHYDFYRALREARP